MRWMLLPALLLLVGCADDHWVTFDVQSSAPLTTVIDSDRIQLEAGIAVGVEALPVENNTVLQRTALRMEPTRQGVIGIDQGVEEDHFVIYGISPGSARIELYFDDEYVGDMPATVLEQATIAEDEDGS